MKLLDRREFLGGSLLATGGLALGFPRSTRAADSRVEILVNEPTAEIAPNIYGHFVEHLGGVVYDGIWVGENSKVPNIGGIRQSLVEALKRIKAPLFRYPGGCFADSYNWRDGIGDRAKRPRRTNFWYGTAGKDVPLNSTSRIEPNEFGTNEFMRFCQLLGGNRISPPICVVCPLRIFTNGSNTLIRPPDRQRLPSSASAVRWAVASRSALNFGGSGTNLGAAAEICCPTNTHRNSAGLRQRFRAITCR